MFDLISILIFFVGTAIGSFLGVIVDRTPSGESIWKGRSHCDHCRHKLHPLDLIPIVSFVILDKKCRYCHKKLSWFFPAIEAMTGFALLLVAALVFDQSLMRFLDLNYIFIFLFYSIINCILIVIFFIDLRYGIIPFKHVLSASIVTLLWYMLIPTLYLSQNELLMLGLQTDIVSGILAGIGAGLFFFAIFFFTKGRGMGFGDVVYAFLMGFVLGFPNVLLGLYIAFVTGAVAALALVATKKKKLKGDTIPFGPFLVLGTIISMLWGDTIIEIVMRYLYL